MFRIKVIVKAYLLSKHACYQSLFVIKVYYYEKAFNKKNINKKILIKSF